MTWFLFETHTEKKAVLFDYDNRAIFIIMRTNGQLYLNSFSLIHS